jgi:hypothetical protein
MANNKSNWRERLESVDKLGKLDCQQPKDVLARLAINDPVFKVKEAAFRAAQARGVTSGGKPIYLGKKPKGDLVSKIKHKLTVVRDSLPDGFSIEEFKHKFAGMYLQKHTILMTEIKEINLMNGYQKSYPHCEKRNNIIGRVQVLLPPNTHFRPL